MTAAIYGTLAVLVLLGGAVMWVTMYTPEPGAHAKPTRAQRERAADEAYLRQLEEVRAEQHMEAGPVTASGMALPGPLMPLPPEVTHEPYTPETLRRHIEDLGGTMGPPVPRAPGWHGECCCGTPGCDGTGPYPEPAQPEDPHDVAAPEDQADAYVGDPAPPEPEPMLTDYRDETGTWERIVVEVAAEAGQP